MALSGTYAFNPPLSSAALLAYSRIGLRPPALTTQHFLDASMEANLAFSMWSNIQPQLWTSELQTQVLTQGTATYTLPIEVVMVLDVYIETTSGSSVIDRVLGAVSTTEYDAFPDKTTQGPPNTYWLNRLITPQITFWPPPDDTQTYTAKIRTVRRSQDAAIPEGTNLDIPYRFLDAFVAELAYRLARIHAQPLEAQRKVDAKEARDLAETSDTENVATYFLPSLGRYYR